jgi:acetyl esterase
VRDSLNQRRGEASRDVNTVGVEIESREAGSIPVRIYCGGPAPAPAVIYCHSGAFVLGNLDTDHRQCVEFARRGRCTVISVDYRLAPEDPYPAGLDDAAAALEWATVNGANLGIDTTRLAVAGSSAGAALAALLAQRAAHGTAAPVVFQLLHQPVFDDRPMPRRRRSSSSRRDSTVQR